MNWMLLYGIPHPPASRRRTSTAGVFSTSFHISFHDAFKTMCVFTAMWFPLRGGSNPQPSVGTFMQRYTAVPSPKYKLLIVG